MKILRIIIPSFTIILIAALIIIIPRKIIINNISCDSQYGICSEELSSRLSEYEGDNLRNTKKGVSNILSEDPLIEDFSTKYQIPDKLEVHTLLKKPYFGIKYVNGDSIALIDKTGHVIAYKEETSLPVLESLGPPPQVFQNIGERRLFSLMILSDMYDYYQVKRAEEMVDGILFKLDEQKKVIFPVEGDRELLIASLAVILTRLNADDTNTKIENVEGLKAACLKGCTIDLRYKNPVIK